MSEKSPLHLIDYFSVDEVNRDGLFNQTMFPDSEVPFSICYAVGEEAIHTINENENITSIVTTSLFMSRVADDKGVVISDDPKRTYFKLHNRLADENKLSLIQETKISKSAVIAPTAVIEKNVVIGENVVISDFALVSENSVIGDHSYIGPYAIIGTRGLQNNFVGEKIYPIQYCGGVWIGKHCEVLAQAVIQKPYQSFFTKIGDGTKISVRASVGHGSSLGINCMVAGNVTIAGNVKSGNNLWIGPGSVIADNIRIGENVKIKMGSVVAGNLATGKKVSGNFAIDHHKHMLNTARLRRDR